MRVRYGSTKDGARKPIAKIYSGTEHRIDTAKIDSDAMKVARRLAGAGFQAYIVGGAVRDLLLGKEPKDFDLVTNAVPGEIKKLFRNARIIGRRFRLAHIHFSGKIIELSTFRAAPVEDPVEDGAGNNNNNVYGSIEEDVHRRDFSINALYYDPINNEVLDFVEGFGDVQKKKMRSLLPLESSFVEDPVRMLRAVKYAVQLNMKSPFRLGRAIKKYSVELERCPPSRLTEELFKIIESGFSAGILSQMIHYRLLRYFLPVIDSLVENKKARDRQAFFQSLEKIDNKVKTKNEKRRGRLIAGLVEGVLIIPEEWENTSILFQDMFKEIKHLIEPLTPPNQEVEMAVVWIFREQGLQVPQHMLKKRRPPLQDQKRPHRRRPPRKHQKKTVADQKD
jgi:poly(A) polymerase